MVNQKKALVFVIIILSLFLAYGFLCEHQISVIDTLWAPYFNEYAKDVTHDDSMWFYKGISTCVQYNGDFNEECDKSKGICSDGKYNNNKYGGYKEQNKYGGYKEQSAGVIDAIKNGGVHKDCPFIYHGTD